MRRHRMVEYDEGAQLGAAARDVLWQAEAYAVRRHAPRVGTAHLLLALVAGDPDAWPGSTPVVPAAAGALMAAAGLSRDRIEDALADYFPAAPIWSGRSPDSGLVWSRGLVWTVREAQREAHVAGSLHTGPSDLLLAATRPHDGTTAARLLEDLVEDPPWLHDRLVRTVLPSRESVMRHAVRQIDEHVHRLGPVDQHDGHGASRQAR